MNKKSSTSQRLLSLDTLRGFDMFWIIGAGELVHHLSSRWPSILPYANQLSHAQWVGLHAYDLIFPLFMFISGVAIPISLSRKFELGISKRTIVQRITKRAIILIILGVVYNGGLSFENVRIASVLGQIGIAYLIASLIFIYTKGIKQQIIWMIGILAGISVVQLFFPVPVHGMGVLTAEGSVNSWIDQAILPGRLHGETYDPEGILCTISASFMTLAGVAAGSVLNLKKYAGQRKALILALSGILFLMAGMLLSSYYPIIKRVWTSTFNLTAGGISLLLMALFYWVIDVLNMKRWTFFFRVIGLNSITIYMLHRIVDFEHISEFFFKGFSLVEGLNFRLVILTGVIIIQWALLYFFYKRNIFLRV